MNFNLIDEADKASKLENIYHKGQDKAWNGKEVLLDLVIKHGMPKLNPEQTLALKNIFQLILWGELAAWKISAQLSNEIEHLEPKLAATSQAHDEARHFYVMLDYLEFLGLKREDLVYNNKYPVLESVLKTNRLSQKILGMHLMVEPVAITIFKLVRKSNVDPILTELLDYYERDEARHIALGVNYLPTLIKDMSFVGVVKLIKFQLKILNQELKGLELLENDFKALGFSKEEVFALAEKKQLEAFELLADELKLPREIWTPIRKAIKFKKDFDSRLSNINGKVFWKNSIRSFERED